MNCFFQPCLFFVGTLIRYLLITSYGLFNLASTIHGSHLFDSFVQRLTSSSITARNGIYSFAQLRSFPVTFCPSGNGDDQPFPIIRLPLQRYIYAVVRYRFKRARSIIISYIYELQGSESTIRHAHTFLGFKLSSENESLANANAKASSSGKPSNRIAPFWEFPAGVNPKDTYSLTIAFEKFLLR